MKKIHSGLVATCASCFRQDFIENCSDWIGWEYDKRKRLAFGLCVKCKNVFKLYNGVKSIEDVIKESEEQI